MLNKNKTGLVLAIFFALLHLVWALIVGLGVAKQAIDWILPLHFIDMLVGVTTFSWVNAILLVVLAFIGGYIIGWVFAWIWNMVAKKR